MKYQYLSIAALLITGCVTRIEYITPELPLPEPQTYAYLLMGVNIVNVVLRLITKAPVTLR